MTNQLGCSGQFYSFETKYFFRTSVTGIPPVFNTGIPVTRNICMNRIYDPVLFFLFRFFKRYIIVSI
jgi:hypothetical protein